MVRSCLLVIILLALLFAPLKTNGAFLYKSYTIRYDRGWDILCDPYVVQKHDWVLKLLKQKGEIANQDFPEFVRIFKRINPHIGDIDTIRPGQHIMIPLRKLKQGTLPGQSTGIVTIPFVTISNKPETLEAHSAAYEVHKGDCVSILIARRFGEYGSKPYHEGMKLFKLINPDITDPDRIFVGQTIQLPDPGLRNQPWYPSLFDRSVASTDDSSPGSLIHPKIEAPEPPVSDSGKNTPGSPLAEAALILNARLYNKGVFYLPRPGREDFRIDLARMPLLELKDGTRIVLPNDPNSQEPEVNILRSAWKNLKVVRLAPGASVEQMFNAVFESLGITLLTSPLSFSDHGVEVETRANWIIDEPLATGEPGRKICIALIDHPDQGTPESIARYLEQHDIVIKDVLTGPKETSPNPTQQIPGRNAENAVTIETSNQRTLVNDLLAAMGYRYAPNVSITFPYAAIQVQAVSNLVIKRNGSPLLIDFGDFYGDAVAAIKKTGFDIIQIKNEDRFNTIIQKLLDALGLPYSNSPTFWAANRPVGSNTALTIPGVLVAEAGGPKVLLADVPLPDGVIQLLKHQGVKVIMLGMPGKYL